MNQAWPPNYLQVFKERQTRYLKVKKNPELVPGLKTYYATHPVDFIQDWCITYDPRNSTRDGLPTLLPFVLFDKQRDLISFLMDCLEQQASGLVEKSRDMGATWACCAMSVWLWLFRAGSSVGWGSRKEILVDKIGDPDSIFEKMRMIIRYLPVWLIPRGYNEKLHSAYMKLINPENGATITGESGDNIGRGGRKAIYFKDESAHYERPERIEAALADTTNCQIDISSVHGTANVFYRRRDSGELWEPGKEIDKGKVQVFILDWRDHPSKDQNWYDTKRERAENEGLLHLFAQEIDRDYASAVEGVLIPSEWVKAAIDAHKILKLEIDGMTIGAVDVADEGGDKNAVAFRKGILLQYIDCWGKGDTGETTNRAITNARMFKATELYYDCIGVGAGFKAESNRLQRENIIPKNLKILPWNAAKEPQFPKAHIIRGDPDSPINRDFFANLKAQAWWRLRQRFENTYRAVVKKIDILDKSDLISISSSINKLHELIKELSQPTYGHDGKNRILIDKKPDGSKSPNLADAVVMAFWPVEKQKFYI